MIYKNIQMSPIRCRFCQQTSGSLIRQCICGHAHPTCLQKHILDHNITFCRSCQINYQIQVSYNYPWYSYLDFDYYLYLIVILLFVIFFYFFYSPRQDLMVYTLKMYILCKQGSYFQQIFHYLRKKRDSFMKKKLQVFYFLSSQSTS